ncbi:hypothetical protein KUH32_02965 [Thalassococcus sp. CAU 1522]|uniref:Lipoprotein n=1 Tax=Thalassococcus arenae TaxID=2851652 RepID=A0ABS6N3X1_9RHOB|nr:hypothetical protein [Thalassococcus arenae]MBV2358721.1 hypothetical protein [Thalassococcus arenae]
MIRGSAVIATALALLAGCAAPPPEPGAFVPFVQVLGETAGRPFECTGYDPVSDTCESVGVLRRSGDDLGAEAFLVLPIAGQPVTLRFTGRGVIRNDRACGVPGSYATEVTSEADQAFKDVFTEVMGVIFESMGELCTAYYRGPDGSYVTEATDEAGQVLPGGRDTAHFFARQPRLRPMSPN